MHAVLIALALVIALAIKTDDGGPVFEDEPAAGPGEARPGDDAPGASTV